MPRSTSTLQVPSSPTVASSVTSPVRVTVAPISPVPEISVTSDTMRSPFAGDVKTGAAGSTATANGVAADSLKPLRTIALNSYSPTSGGAGNDQLPLPSIGTS